ncbi:hypothetical protein FQA47_011736 [Oryzias melastigma]|uniref:Uncharacterized protein n=1 Tax=Oryzias melastigma TaxID=30732 RepID=A0A834FPB5_ORYME|nr:hypothetical protein FQA47_011736 [Oryzias melastigma]
MKSRGSSSHNGRWNCAMREGCCPVTGQLGQQMVIFPLTNTNLEERERRGSSEWSVNGNLSQYMGMTHP